MSAECFLDTNVFIYHLDQTDARKHAIAEQLVRSAVVTRSCCISFQVVQECLNTALRKAKIPLDRPAMRAYLDGVLAQLVQVSVSTLLLHRALELHERYRFSFYDSLIVASALAAGCTRLLTEDLQHGQRIDTLTIENPFR